MKHAFSATAQIIQKLTRRKPSVVLVGLRTYQHPCMSYYIQYKARDSHIITHYWRIMKHAFSATAQIIKKFTRRKPSVALVGLRTYQHPCMSYYIQYKGRDSHIITHYWRIMKHAFSATQIIQKFTRRKPSVVQRTQTANTAPLTYRYCNRWGQFNLDGDFYH